MMFHFIPIKCNLHAWMQAYFVVLKTSHFAVTGEDGRFALPDLPPGKYTITAWHETNGTRSQDITIADGQSLTVDFVFQATELARPAVLCALTGDGQERRSSNRHIP
jgi:hypothetical protein